MPRLAVIGHPVSHSLSPVIHTAALRALGMEEWSYEAIDIAPADLAERVLALPGEGFVGVNVTIPHKEAALRLSAAASERAREIGASNTLSFSGGAVVADNTDAEGLLASLPEDRVPGRALVLGAGGAARAVVWALASRGAEVWIWNRTAERAQELASRFDATALSTRERGRAGDWKLPAVGYDLIVNTTSVGLPRGGAATRPEDAETFNQLPISADSLHDRQIVVDLAYRADGDTELVSAARARGCRVVDGLEVLARQGAASFRIWTGVEPPVEVMRNAAREGQRR